MTSGEDMQKVKDELKKLEGLTPGADTRTSISSDSTTPHVTKTPLPTPIQHAPGTMFHFEIPMNVLKENEPASQT